MSNHLLCWVSIVSVSCVYYSSSLTSLKMSILILYLSWVNHHCILVRNISCALSLTSSQFLLINNLTRSWINSILVNIKLTITFLIHGSFFSDGSHIVILIGYYLIVDWIDSRNILLWNLSAIITMSISCCCSFVQLNVIQFDLPNVWVRYSYNSFHSSFSNHIDLGLSIIVILDIHNFLVRRFDSRMSFD